MNKKQLNTENKEIWNANASFWDDAMGAKGNDWHLELIAPATEELLDLKPNDTLLDVACGNGIFARSMAQKGVQVTAFDFSEKNIENAKKYDCKNIQYFLLDASLESDLQKLEKNAYKAIVSNMVFMDMPEIALFFSKVNELMTDDGSFVFSIQHPCFNSELAQNIDDEKIVVTDYINEHTSKGEAITNQPKKQYYFHRPISYYVNLGVANGLVLSGMAEPTFEEGIYAKFPPVLILKMIRK